MQIHFEQTLRLTVCILEKIDVNFPPCIKNRIVHLARLERTEALFRRNLKFAPFLSERGSPCSQWEQQQQKMSDRDEQTEQKQEEEDYTPDYSKYDEDSVPPEERHEVKQKHPGRPDLEYDEIKAAPAPEE